VDRRYVLVLLLAGAALAASSLFSSAQQPPAPAPPRFGAAIDLTTVTATVTDADGHLVTGLPREAFDVFEDGQRQTIAEFTNERVPVSLGVLLDVSDSMFGKRIEDARSAVDRFLFDLLDLNDEFFVMVFNHQPHVLTRWTREAELVRRALAGIKPFGGTATNDALMAAIPVVADRSRQRAALVLISDGADTGSNATRRDLRNAFLRSDVFVYAVAIDSPDRQPINTRVNAQALREITAENGGRTEVVQNSSDLAAATASIAEELNSQYLLGYASPRGRDGQFHSIRVRVSGTGYRVRARSGYVAIPRRQITN
jgi:Ca-activated chloride channel family protein